MSSPSASRSTSSGSSATRSPNSRSRSPRLRALSSTVRLRPYRLAATCASLTLLIVSAGCGGGEDSASSQTQEQQVAAGRDVYAGECAKCHGEQGEGGTGPEVIGGSRRIATYETTTRLYDYVSRTMPFDDAGSLSEEQYWNSIAYLLDENELLPVEVVLGPDADEVKLER